MSPGPRRATQSKNKSLLSKVELVALAVFKSLISARSGPLSDTEIILYTKDSFRAAQEFIKHSEELG